MNLSTNRGFKRHLPASPLAGLVTIAQKRPIGSPRRRALVPSRGPLPVRPIGQHQGRPSGPHHQPSCERADVRTFIHAVEDLAAGYTLGDTDGCIYNHTSRRVRFESAGYGNTFGWYNKVTGQPVCCSPTWSRGIQRATDTRRLVGRFHGEHGGRRQHPVLSWSRPAATTAAIPRPNERSAEGHPAVQRHLGGGGGRCQRQRGDELRPAADSLRRRRQRAVHRNGEERRRRRLCLVHGRFQPDCGSPGGRHRGRCHRSDRLGGPGRD